MDSPEKTPPSAPGPEYGAQLRELASGQKLGRGRYTLIRLLGKGGMGVVWLARDEKLGEELALKLLPEQISGDATALDDMRRETQKSRKLTHPNIIRIHDIFEDDGEPCFISMEYVDGPNLSSMRLQQPTRFFTWAHIAPIIKQLCEALHYAHTEGVIHRDLKPANFMLDGRGRLKLADFGIAAVVSDSMGRISMKHATSGTITYMSPQQMAGQPPRPTDDIYALGATIYELLTSKPPFYSGDIQYQVVNVAAVPMEQRLADLGLQNDIPPAVGALVMACLSKDPAQRPPSGAAVAQWMGVDIGSSQMSPSDPNASASLKSEAEPALPASVGGGRSGLWIGLAVCGVAVVLGLVVFFALRKEANPPPNAGNTKEPAAPAVTTSSPSSDGYVDLFNGRDFFGWKVPRQNHWWTIKDGSLIGKQSPKFGGNVLETEAVYQDFIIDCDARWSSNADSGIFVRANQMIQCQIGVSPIREKDMTGAIFITGGGAGGYPEEPRNLQKALKPNAWNHFRFQVQGAHYQIWVNGEQTADYTSPAFPNPGPIGLQILDKAKEMQVEFRNIRLQRLESRADISPPAAGGNDFESLFNGANLIGWRGDPTCWTVMNGTIHGKLPVGDKRKENTFLIWRGGAPDDFELRLKFKAVSGNSGVQYRSRVVNDAKFILGGYQYEIDADKVSVEGALYDEKGGRSFLANVGERVIIGPDGRRTAPLKLPGAATFNHGDWNQLVIVAQGSRLIHQLNGTTVVDVTDEETGKSARAGSLGLQLHADPPQEVWFKDIQFKRLSGSSRDSAKTP